MAAEPLGNGPGLQPHYLNAMTVRDGQPSDNYIPSWHAGLTAAPAHSAFGNRNTEAGL
jgi:hypothetical protein